MRNISVADVVTRVSNAAFGKPLVTNVMRGQVVEAIVALALEPEWTWCAADYTSWDFERADGRRLEIKQSARAQSWASPDHGRVHPTFDIRPRTGRWEDTAWMPEPGRAADAYVLAWNDYATDLADHRDPAQWIFYVVSTSELPDQNRIGLGVLKRLTDAVSIANLHDAVSAAVGDRGAIRQ